MKKRYVVLVSLMALGFFLSSCNKDREVYQEPQGNESFKDLKVPDNFTWSAIADKNLSVTIQLDGQETSAFDATPLDLMDENHNLIDRSTIYNGQVEFFFRVPTKTKTIKLYSPLVNESQDFSIDENVVLLNFDIKPQKAALVDTDGDGIADRFDDFPQDAQRAYSISFPASANKQYLKNAVPSDFKGGPAPGEPEYTSPEGGECYYYQIFEDLWPSMGDYDLNDMVLKTKYGWDKHSDNSLKHVYFQTIVQAVGASIRSGLGWEFLKYNGVESKYLNNIVTWYGAPADPDVNCGVICFNDVREWQTTPYHNTSASGIDAKPDTIEFQVYIPRGVVCGFELIPYLFRSNNPSHQVRPFGAPPTASADMGLFGTYDDASPSSWNGSPGTVFPTPLTGEDAFYRTAENLPWAVEFIAADFEVAEEKTDFLLAYPLFQNWAESGGTENQDWYLYPDHTHTYVPSW